MDDSIIVLTLAGAIAAGAPIALAGLGELLAERSGVLNLALEGMMLIGAVAAFLVMVNGGSIPLGFLAGALAAATIAAMHAVLSLEFRANQVLSGLALFVFAIGVTRFVGDPYGFRPVGRSLQPVAIPIVSEIPILGRVLFTQDVMVYVTCAVAVVIAVYIKRTRPGLSLRAVGESPAASDTVGLPVSKIRYIHTLVGGALAGIAGTHVILTLVTTWNHELTIGGLGWIGVGLVVFSSWQPVRLLLGAFIFGLALRTNFALQALGNTLIPAEMLSMLPYLLTIGALVLLARGDFRRRLGAPAALGLPYAREER